IIHDRRIANIFVQEFAARYHESGGSAELYSKVDADAEQTGIAAPTDYQLLQNYPNPFNQNTVITCWVPDTNNKATIDIYNTRGERLARLPIARNAKKWVRISWDGTDDGHNKLPSGIYFAKTSGGSVTIKIIIVR
ncbi:T9SS type A sorting domain-containing protein, partial [candidate division KSB1 bacterium]|nr:T9SS type A sorting domain-containing protein [candidate division KSB1 bacterium]